MPAMPNRLAPIAAALGALLALSACSPPPPAMAGATAATEEGTREPDVDLGPPTVPPGTLLARQDLRLDDRCGDTCIFQRRGESVLRLDLQPGGVAEALDRGVLLESMSSVVGPTEFLSQWSRSWKGSWSADARTMEVRLEPQTTTCSRKAPNKTEDPSCSALPLLLKCFRSTVPLFKPKGRTSAAWACEPAAKISADALTSFPWVFGTRKRLVALERGTQLQRERYYKAPQPKARRQGKRVADGGAN